MRPERLYLLDIQQKRFDLGGEHVYTADDEHVVGTAGNLVHLDRGPSTGARLSPESRDVPGSIPDQGKRLLLKRCEDELSVFVEGAHGVFDQGLVVFVDVEVAFAHLGAGEGGWVDEDPVVGVAVLGDPARGIVAEETVLGGVEAVGL